MSQMRITRLKTVTRAEYMAYVNAHDHELTDHPTEGYQIAVMQMLNDAKEVRAQAFYEKGQPARYEIPYDMSQTENK